MEELLENLESVEMMIDQAETSLSGTKFADDKELAEYIENIQDNIKYALDVVKDS